MCSWMRVNVLNEQDNQYKSKTVQSSVIDKLDSWGRNQQAVVWGLGFNREVESSGKQTLTLIPSKMRMRKRRQNDPVRSKAAQQRVRTRTWKKTIQAHIADPTSRYIKERVGMGRREKTSDSGKTLWRRVGQAGDPGCGNRSRANAETFCWDPLWSRAGFPGGSEVKNPPADAGGSGSIPGWGRSPGGGNGNRVGGSPGVTKSQIQLSDLATTEQGAQSRFSPGWGTLADSLLTRTV